MNFLIPDDMPDKNLTDTEIKKAFEVLDSWQQVALQNDDGTDTESPKLYEAIEIVRKEINRLQAENERLKNAYKQVAWERDIFAEDMKEEIKKDCSYLMLDIKTIKAEAYKEFVEKANEIIDLIVDLMFDGSVSKCQLPNCHKPSSIPCENEICIQENKEYWHSKLNNLLKELVGE